MVVDRLENIEKYASLNPLFAQAIDVFEITRFKRFGSGKNRT